jgi:hypothetical protein
MYDHVTLKLAAGFNLDLPVLNAASDLSTRFYEKSRTDNQTALEATTYHRALGLYFAFARTRTAENKFPTFNPTAVNIPSATSVPHDLSSPDNTISGPRKTSRTRFLLRRGFVVSVFVPASGHHFALTIGGMLRPGRLYCE